jgi:Phycobilisome protein
MSLSDAAKELVVKARIMNFSAWRPLHSPEAIALFQTADDQHRYLTDEDCARLAQLSPKVASLLPIAQMLRDRASEIVDEARAQVLAEYPGISEPGGRLHPELRAEACWRDFWHFLRSIHYGLAGNTPEYTSQVGLHFMEALYQELRVPLDAMTSGLEYMKVASLQRVEPELRSTLTPYFEHLIRQMQHFSED